MTEVGVVDGIWRPGTPGIKGGVSWVIGVRTTKFYAVFKR